MNGTIVEHPLVEVVREIHQRHLSGALRLTRDRIKAVLYLDKGELIFATSNLRAHRLDVCLEQWNFVAPEQLATMRQTTSSELELSSRLIISGALNKEKMNDALTRRTEEIARTALMLPDGEWSFAAGFKPAQAAHDALNLNEMLMDCARRLPAAKITARITGGDEKFSLEKGSTDLTMNLLPTEGFILSRADAPITPREIIMMSGLSEAEALRALYTLAVGGLLRRETWPPMLDNQAQDVSAASSAASRQTETVKEAEHVQPKEKDERVRMEELFARADTNDYYEVLGVEKTADTEKIKSAYYALAKSYHPDRFQQKQNPAVRTRIEAAFTHIRQAYDTLKRERARAAYDHDHDGASATPFVAKSDFLEPPPVAPTPLALSPEQIAEDKFKQGTKEYEYGNDVLAVARLSEAVQLAPQQARYHAQYARALARNEQTRRMAEAEYAKAISLDARNVAYYVWLAELYREMGLKRRAENNLMQALAIDPRRADARKLLDEIRASGVK